MSQTVIDGQFDDADEDNIITATPEIAFKRVDDETTADDDVNSQTSDALEDDFDQDEDLDDDDDVDYEDEWYEATGDFTKDYNKARTGQALHFQKTAMRDTQGKELAAKFASHVRVDLPYEVTLSSTAKSSVIKSDSKADGDAKRRVDKSDRATVEQALDPRTRIILFKFLNKNILSEINGCISTGKEANVYHGITNSEPEDGSPPTQLHRAIKVYKTSILTFKDRDRYVNGEFRFRHGYGRGNPRKMVKVWAEKEMRNLKRLYSAGIPCPEPLLLRMHVLVMEFLGDSNGWAAPRVKDAPIHDSESFLDLYLQLIKIMWRMYHQCHLVHADLSEYNLLYHNKKIYVIDVSQSVEHDHPHALEFLRKDCTNVIDFFAPRVPREIPVTNTSNSASSATPDIPSPVTKPFQALSMRDLFEFIVTDESRIREELQSLSNTNNNVSTMELDDLLTAYLASLHENVVNRPTPNQVDEAVFQQTYIPRTLDQVRMQDIEGDVDAVMRGDGDSLIYKSVTGLVTKQPQSSVSKDTTPNPTADTSASIEESGSSTGSDNDNGSENSESDDDDSSNRRLLKKDEDKDLKKERKRQVKEENRLKRLEKVPKSVKKRKVKESARKGKH
ncbi:hypothetical protein SmJEL517_g03652 [Synchytrium microbalum]|uniref:Serine/threonine-protein kinase RIO1 n=1 Tax=Synchytrium microbalum TaxID=1806994 RepID=A0A507C328_9FUNG|nr:uncharacterized protein SmJEL517_g03652 [Synchytrium microbalum]TPX33449.1 hypothetical protein SmJEL517_g03652 [Synchytrium microbalum]